MAQQMSDDLHIPAMAGAPGRAPVSSSYRPRRMAEPGMRAMAIAAAAIGGILLLGIGGWALIARHPTAIPVIEADTRPLRVKPENPGGMQVAGAEEQVLGGNNAGADRMAPSPEAPAPQALRAQMQQTTPTQPPPPGAPVAPLAIAPNASPLPDTPTRPQATPRAAAAPAPTPAKPATGMQVQLASVDSEAAAQSEWQRLARKMPDLLGDRRPTIQRAEANGHPVWRIRTGGFADMAEATSFCTKLKAKGAACTLASF